MCIQHSSPAARRSLGRANRNSRGFTLIELLVVIAIIAILIALLVPAVQKVRESAARTQCNNKLKQIALALHNYHDREKIFPQHTGELNNTWIFKILPYLEQESLYREAPKPGNDDMYNTPLVQFMCPSDPRGVTSAISSFNTLYGTTSYLANTGRDYNLTPSEGVIGIFLPGGKRRSVRLRDILDGTSNTLLAGERPPGGGGTDYPDEPQFWGWWAYDSGHSLMWTKMPAAVNAADKNGNPCAALYYFQKGDINNDCDANHYWSVHSGGGHFAMCDGSVHFFDYSVGPMTLTAMSTRAGGETNAVVP